MASNSQTVATCDDENREVLREMFNNNSDSEFYDSDRDPEYTPSDEELLLKVRNRSFLNSAFFRVNNDMCIYIPLFTCNIYLLEIIVYYGTHTIFYMQSV